MPSSYTPSLRLTLPVTGELSGQWGTTVNNGITELLDSAVAGTATISTWGGAGVAYTLTSANGAADEARKMFIVATGAPGEAKNVICPAVSKLYVFRNDTTGGFALTLKTSGGTGIAVAAGQAKLLYCDGTNVVEAVNALGPLANLTASQAVFTDASKNLVSNAITGTGNVVMSASPTLTGTVGAASLTLSSLTSGRVTYAGASGLLQDSANLTFNGTDLTVSGAVNAGSVNATTLDLTNLEVTNIKAKDGTASASIADSTGVMSLVANPVFSGGTANGVLYLNGSKVATSGSALTFDGTTLKAGAGGTGAATAQLTLDGGSAANGGGYIRFSRNGSTITYVGNDSAVNGGTSDDFDIYASSNIRFYAFNTEGMRLTSTGLGIGTSSPSGKLDVAGSLGTFRIETSGARAVFTRDDANYIRYGSASGTLIFEQGVTERMRIDSSGNLGLGVTPSAWGSGIKALQVGPTSALVNPDYGYTLLTENSYNNGTADLYLTTRAASSFRLYNGGFQFFTAPSGTAGTAITFTQAMTLDASGNLGVGTSSPGSYGVLAVDTSKGATGVTLGDFTTLANDTQLYMRTSGLAKFVTTAGGSFTFGSSGGSERMRIDSSGNLLLGTATNSNNRRLLVNGTGSGATYLAVGDISQTSNQVVLGIEPSASLSWLSSTTWPVAFGVNGSEQMRLTSTGLGIGTSSPGYKLDVRGAGLFLLSGAGSTTPLILRNDTGGATTQVVKLGFDSSGAIKSSINAAVWNNDYMTFNVGSDTERMRLDASGNVGIGTSSPGAILHTLKTSAGAATVGAFLQNSDTTTGTEVRLAFAANTNVLSGDRYAWIGCVNTGGGNSGALTFATNVGGSPATERMRLDASGNVGIGATSPGERLYVSSANGTVQIGATNGTISQRVGYCLSGVAYSGSATNHPYALLTNDLERMRITSAGDVGIGTSSPGYKLDVSVGTNTIAQQWQGAGTNFTLRLRSGNGATPSSSVYRLYMDYLNGSNTGGYIDFYRGLAGNDGYLVFGTAGSDRMTLDSSGNLGLGVTPSAWNASATAIEQKNGVAWYSFGAASNANFVTNAFANSAGNFIYKTTDLASRYQQISGTHLWLTAPSGTAGTAITFTQAMTLDASGNLLVGGTSTPYAAANRGYVNINGATDAVLGLSSGGTAKGYIQATSTDVTVGAAAGNNILFNINGERARITSGGDLLVGNTAALGGLTREVLVNTASGSAGINFSVAASLTGRIRSESASTEIGTVNSAPLIFNTANTERARITSGGDLLVGTTSTNGRVNSDVGSSTTLNAYDGVSPNNYTGITYQSRSVTAAGTTWYHFAGQSGNGTAVTTNNILIFGNGNVQNTNNSYGAISDVKLKENIADATPKLAGLMRVRVVNYNLKTDPERKQIGVIAQELEQVFPGMVEETPDRDADGELTGETTKAVKYSVFVPMLIKALQEQQAIIDSLKARLDAANL